MESESPTKRKRFGDWRLWILALCNVFIAGHILPLCQELSVSTRLGLMVLFAFIQSQGVLLATVAALLPRRPAYAVFAIPLLSWCLSVWIGAKWMPGFQRVGVITTAMLPLFVFAVLHGVRIWFGWRITREPLVDQRAGQFQTLDLLEWTFTVAVPLGVASYHFAPMNPRPSFFDLFGIAISLIALTLLVQSLALTLLRERLRWREFAIVAAIWIVVEGGMLSWGSWQQNKSIWPSGRLMDLWLQSSLIFLVMFVLTTVANSLIVRMLGYRWRSRFY